MKYRHQQQQNKQVKCLLSKNYFYKAKYVQNHANIQLKPQLFQSKATNTTKLMSQCLILTNLYADLSTQYWTKHA